MSDGRAASSNTQQSCNKPAALK